VSHANAFFFGLPILLACTMPAVALPSGGGASSGDGRSIRRGAEVLKPRLGPCFGSTRFFTLRGCASREM
jgi:hypothetical protein